MAKTTKIVQSMPDNTRPPPPSNMHYLFRSARTFTLWALAGIGICLLFWAVLLGLFLWSTR